MILAVIDRAAALMLVGMIRVFAGRAAALEAYEVLKGEK